MRKSLGERSNEEWIVALRGGKDLTAPRELEDYLERSLWRALRNRRDISAHDMNDFVQEGLLQILQRLDTFRGDSQFATWASAVAIRATLTELRKRNVRSRGRTSFDVAMQASTLAPSAEEWIAQSQLNQELHRAIQRVLTDRQRVALLAELRGIPTIEIATRLGITQNALYKLVHDARKKLKVALVASGFTDDLTRQGTSGQ